MKKLIFIVPFALLVFIVSIIEQPIVQAAEIEPFATETPDITTEFSAKMRKNALTMAYYAQHDKTHPIGTGLEFASKVKPSGPWDYKRTYGTTKIYKWVGGNVKGEDLGNMHYGYVGRAAKFSATLLKSAAGAVQIYSGTAHGSWYRTYFDDPRDQSYITKGINYWNNVNLPTKSLVSTDIPDELIITDADFDELTDDEKTEIRKRAEDNTKAIMELEKYSQYSIY